MPPTRTLKKIVVRLASDAWHGHATETLWAERIDDSRYRLRSVPFYATGLSVEDIVATHTEDGVDVVTGVSMYGGHSTYRIFLATGVSPESQVFKQYWAPLSTMGCTFERATERLFGVDIPPHANLQRAYDCLVQGETGGAWDFEEGSVSPNAHRS